MPIASPTVPGAGIQESYPLTPLQQGLLVQALRAPGSGIDIEQVVCRLREAVDEDRLEHAWARVVRRHGILRTRFRWADVPEPLQEVLPRVAVPVERTDLSALPSAGAERRLEAWLEADRGRGFDLGEAPAMRLALFRLGEGEQVLVWSFHHILLDGRSVTHVLRELFALYDAAEMDEAEASLGTQRPFRGHVGWLRGRDPAADRAFWTALFRGMDAPEPLRSLRAAPRDPAREAPFGTRELRLTEADTAALRAFEGEQGVWLNTVVQGAWALLLGRFTGGPEVVFGVVRGGRAAEADGAEPTVGLLINTVPVRVAVQTDASVLDWLDGIGEQGSALVPHEHAALADVARWSGLPQGAALFDTLLDFQPQSFDAPLRALGGAWEGRSLGIRRRPGLPLSLSVAGERRLRLRMDYDADRFDAAAVDALLGRFAVLLQAIAAGPELPVSRVPLVLPGEREALLAAGRATRGFPVAERIHARFERRAAERPEAPALTFGGTTLSYGELNARANRLAHRLIALGVGPETRVGIALERSAELVVAVLAVLKAGGGYVPVDPAYPVDRIAFVLEDSEAPVLVTTDDLRARLPAFGGTTLCVDTDADAIAAESAENPSAAASVDSLAYVIYTSGSTGKPKGVQVTHANVVRLFDATDSWFRFGAEDVWTLFHSAAFDFSVWEIWGALLYGGRLVVVPYLTTRSPEHFHRLLVEEGVTVLNQTPSAFRQLVQADLASGVPADALRLRYVIFGGEALDPYALRPWIERHGDDRPRLVNMYGITETTVHVTWREITRADLERGGSPIGIPIPDLSLYLLDRALEPVPAGVPGELFVGGAGVARGYLNRPELTAERFVRDPFSDDPDARLYRTGDLARRRLDGELEYLGRADQQVKIRGFRIETGEIEAALASHPAIATATVVVREDAAGEKRLAAYVVARAGETAPTAAELRAHVSAGLPEHMVPAGFVALDTLPLTENGKLDRRALPAPEEAEGAVAAEAYVAPGTEAERDLAEVWRDVLGLERVGIDDNYIALGGDSIQSVRIVAAARGRGLAISIPHIYRHQTVRELATVADRLAGPAPDAATAAPFALLDPAARAGLPDDVEDAYPASRVQLGMLYHTESDPASLVYLNLNGYRVHTRFDEAALREALRRIAARHPLLRTSFDLGTAPEPVQRVHREAGIPLEVTDLRGMDEAERDEAFERLKETRFDWTRAPLLRFHAHLFADDEFRLVLVEHHAVLDGWSVASLMTELLRLFAALRDGVPDPTGAPPAAGFRDFVALERAALASDTSRAFWRRVLDDAPVAVLPPREGSAAAVDEAAWQSVDLPVENAGALRRVAERAGVPLKTVILAAHLRVLSLMSGSDDVVTGYVTSGRPETEDGERVLGLFLNTVPLRVGMEGCTWESLIRRVWAAEDAVLPHRRFPLSEIVRENGGAMPFETAFNLNHFHVYDALAASGVRLRGDRSFQKTEIPLLANALVNPATGELRLRLEHDPARLDEAQVAAIGRWYGRALEAVAADPGAVVSATPLLGPGEREGLLAAGRATRGFPVAERVHERFERRATERPDAPALTFGGETIAYGELNARANRLAHRLIARGVGPETRVGIALERSAELVVAILAVLKAGGGYVPLDPAYPVDRIAFVLEDSQAPVLVTTDDLRARLPAFGGTTLCVDTDADAIAAESAENLRVDAGPDSLAYVIYTSGSTGKPKGVQVTHANVVRLFDATEDWFGFGAEDVWTLFHSAAFDFSVWEIWGALLYGGRLVVVPYLTTRSPEDFHRLLVDEGVTVLNQTPSAFRQLVQADLASGVPADALRLRYVVFGGEALDPHVLRPWMERHGDDRPRLVNMYGITETTVHVTWREITRADLERGGSPIGIPIPDLSLYLLDRALEPVPAGVPGELYVGGVGVARGYLNRPELTAERFVRDPFSADAGRAAVPHGRPGAAPAGRRAGVPGPRGPAGEDPRLPHRDGGDRGRPGVAPGDRERRRRRAGRHGGGEAARRLRRRACGRDRADGGGAARARLRRPAGLHGPGRVRGAGRAPADGERQAGPPRPPRAGGGGGRRRGGGVRGAAHGGGARPRGGVARGAGAGARGHRRQLLRAGRRLHPQRADRRRGAAPGARRHHRRAGAPPDRARPGRGHRRGPGGSRGGGAGAVRAAGSRGARRPARGRGGRVSREPRAAGDALPHGARSLFPRVPRGPGLPRPDPLGRGGPARGAAPDRRAAPPAAHLVRPGRRAGAHPAGAPRSRHPAGGDGPARDGRGRAGRGLQPAEGDGLRLDAGAAGPLPRPSLRRRRVPPRAGGAPRRDGRVERGVAHDGAPPALRRPARRGAGPHGRAARGRLPRLRGAGAGRAGVGYVARVLAAGAGGCAGRRAAAAGGRRADAAGRGALAVGGPPGRERGRPAAGGGARGGAAQDGDPGGAPARALAAERERGRRHGLRDQRAPGDGGRRAGARGLPQHRAAARGDGRLHLGTLIRAGVGGGGSRPATPPLPPLRDRPRGGGHTPFEAAFNFIHFHVYDALAASGVRLRGDRSFQKTEIPLLANALVIPATGELRLRLEYDPARLGEAQVAAIGQWYRRALSALDGGLERRWDADELLGDAEARAAAAPGSGRAAGRRGAAPPPPVRAPGARHPGRAGPAVRGHDPHLRRAERARQPARPPPAAVGRGAGDARGRVPGTGAGAGRRPDRRAQGGRGVRAAGPRLSTGAAARHPARLRRAPAGDARRAPGPAAGRGRGAGGVRGQAAPEIAAEPADDPQGGAVARSLAYLIYTSGSTGVPKGVAIEHDSATAMLEWAWTSLLRRRSWAGWWHPRPSASTCRCSSCSRRWAGAGA